MESENARLSFRCTQCGADLDTREGEIFVACAHCASALYLDRSGVVFHYLLARILNAQSAHDTLKRWMSGAGTAKDLDRLAEIEPPELRYFPLWRFRTVDNSGEQVHVEPAVEETLLLLQGMTIPPGELRFFRDHNLAPLLVQPTISCEAAAAQLRAAEASGPKLHEAALVHVPFYFFQYCYRNETYEAAVDAASGEVLAGVYPARQDLAYRILGMVTFVAFFLAAIGLYWFLYIAGDKLIPALSLRCGVQLLLAVPLFFLAWLVARRV